MSYAEQRAARGLRRDDEVLREWFATVESAAALFESRWTRRALRRVDAALADRLREQRDLFDQAMVTGTADEIETQGAAMCRGYVAACGALERAEVPDDAYMLGGPSVTGLRVAIGVQKAAATRVAELHGAIWMTPDEVSDIMSSAPFNKIAAAKLVFPGIEVVEFRKTESDDTKE